MWSRWTLLATAVGLATMLGACGGDDDPAATAKPSTTVESTTAPAEDSPAAQIEGRWITTIVPGDDVTLTLLPSRYFIVHVDLGGRAQGAARWDAETVEFFDGDHLCTVSSVYEWDLEGDVLTFTLVGADPCGDRSEVLDGQAYNRD